MEENKDLLADEPKDGGKPSLDDGLLPVEKKQLTKPLL